MDEMREEVTARRWLRLAAVLVPAIGLVALLGFGLRASTGPPAPGDAAPAFSAPRLDGNGTLALADLRGRPVVLNFWASWCEPCLDEAAMFEKANRDFGDRVAFVGVDVRDDREDALKFVSQYGLDYPHVRDEDLSIYEDYGLTGQPETFFIDSGGTIVAHVNGPLFEGDLFALLDELVQ
jgi:cytochrome c biogenesis protein CcmG, thiol:disulfide interchange protein DsbE